MNRRGRVGPAGAVWILLVVFLFLFLTGLGLKERSSNISPRDSVNRLITKDGLKTMTIALDLYRREFGEYPETLEEILRYKKIDDRSVIEDAWGREYHYLKTGDTYVLFSLGADGKPFSEDDIYPEEE